MDASARAWMVVAAVGATFAVVPAVAWAVWLRRARPRPTALLVVAIATTTPLTVVVAGGASAVIQLRSAERSDDNVPSQRARVLAETISETMNVAAVAVLGAMAISGCVIAASLWRRRNRDP